MIRHWDRWDDAKRSHVFVVEVATGKARDLTPSLAVNAPPAPFGGSSDYTFTPDGKAVVFTAEPAKDMAWSTNTDLWMIGIASTGGPVNLTKNNPGADNSPAFSTGGTLAYLSQSRRRVRSRPVGPPDNRPQDRQDDRPQLEARPPDPVVPLGQQ